MVMIVANDDACIGPTRSDRRRSRRRTGIGLRDPFAVSTTSCSRSTCAADMLAGV
jgi:hypothetical protein